MIDPVPFDGSDIRFPSLASLRLAHAELLKRQRETSDAAGLQGEILDLIRRGQETGALLDQTDERWEAQSILDYWVTFLFRIDRTTVDATLDELDPELAPKLDDADCPFVGLDAFQESRFEVFFGRQRLLEKMLDRLVTARFLAVVGSSGSGKSSVVRAGVLAALKQGALTGSASWWFPPPLVPGSEPLINLVRALSPDGTDGAAVASRAARLRDDPRSVLELVAAQAAGRPCVLLVDQLEELFTLCDDELMRQAFADALSAIVQAPGIRHTLLVTLRSDFETRVARLGRFHDLFEKAEERVTPLSASELRDAILRPAELAGLKFEEGVVDALLRDILGEPAGLPLLQFTLLKLWESRDHNRVTWQAYNRLGGGRLALARTADELYASLLPQDQTTARRILLRMVRPSEGLEVMSSRVRRTDLDRSEDPGRVEHVLGKLLGARLVRLTKGETPADDQVEVAHEALVRNWPKLVDWLEEERADIAVRRRLESLVDEWLRLEKRGGLFDEIQLQEAERWLASSSAALLGYHPELPAMVQASREAITEAKQREEEARRREVQQAQQLAEAERERAEVKTRSSRLFRTLAVIATVLLLFSIWTSTRALESQRKASEAQKAAVEARSEKDAAQLAAQAAAQNARIAQQDAELMAEAKLRQAAEESRQEIEKALVEAQTQKELAENALKDLREQKALTDAALDEAKEQRLRAEAALEDVKDQKQLLEGALDTARIETRRAQAALADAEAARQRAEESQARYDQVREQVVETRSENLQLTGLPERSGNRVLAEPRKLKLDRRSRPLLVGASIGTLHGGNGSLCCAVKDRTGQLYLLSLASIFKGEPGAPVLQPGRLDGGTPAENKVGNLVRLGKGAKLASIAKLDSDVGFDIDIPTLGPIRGVEQRVRPGDIVRLVGRASGIVEGKVIEANDREVVTTILPKSGDGGGAVLSDDNELVGLLYGSDKLRSFVVRIEPILDELDVQLVLE